MNSRKNPVILKINPDRVMDYCDTVEVMMTGCLSSEQQNYIQYRSGELIYSKRKAEHLSNFIRWLSIHQPTVESVRRLIEVTQEAKIEVHLYRVDFARDYVFNTFEEAWEWGEFFKRHLVKRWHGKQTVGGYEDAMYYSSNRANVSLNQAVYDDLPNRFTGQPNVHLEFRITGKQALGRYGINHLEDIVRYGEDGRITKFIENQLVLRSIGKQAKKWIVENRTGCNSNYLIGKKELKSRWFPRLMNIFERHGIQVIIDGNARIEKSTSTNNRTRMTGSFIQSLDVFQLDYSTPLFQPEANQDISLMHGGLIISGCTYTNYQSLSAKNGVL
ncbi:MAG TPA: hypothetical protein P5102_06570 [Candidatus Competibacteraceae bacterium]|nr:hypothetical protein [Candidatus Competibacteraceae bacterium]HSA45643.1 hypothetical protein [Candidatus Competibacteraceae bacterium]